MWPAVHFLTPCQMQSKPIGGSHLSFVTRETGAAVRGGIPSIIESSTNFLISRVFLCGLLGLQPSWFIQSFDKQSLSVYHMSDTKSMAASQTRFFLCPWSSQEGTMGLGAFVIWVIDSPSVCESLGTKIHGSFIFGVPIVPDPGPSG